MPAPHRTWTIFSPQPATRALQMQCCARRVGTCGARGGLTFPFESSEVFAPVGVVTTHGTEHMSVFGFVISATGACAVVGAAASRAGSPHTEGPL